MIELTISRADIDRWAHHTFTAIAVMSGLRDKGAPVVGALFPIAVPGRLVFENDAFDDLQVTWQEGADVSPAPVEVVVTRHDITRWDNNSIFVGDHVMKVLRAKGVPVKGLQFPTSIERGRLTIENDAFDDLVVAWREA